MGRGRGEGREGRGEGRRDRPEGRGGPGRREERMSADRPGEDGADNNFREQVRERLERQGDRIARLEERLDRLENR